MAGHDSWTKTVNASFIYAKCTRAERQTLWSELSSIVGSITWLWLIGGDFNIISTLAEYTDRTPQDLGAISDFNTAISNCRFQELPYTGSSYTWSGIRAGTRIWKQLDRTLVNQQWLGFLSNTSIQHLNRTTFDNSPLVIGSFRHKGMQKEVLYEAHPTKEAREALHCAQGHLLKSFLIQEEDWRQKAGLRWLKDGDCNTRFFHASVREKRTKLVIHRIKDEEGAWVEDEDQIAREAVDFFQRLLTAEEVGEIDELLIHVPELVTANQNVELLREVTMEEVKRVVFDLDKDSAPGADGYTVARDFMAGIPIPKGIASTLIVLLPKKSNPSTFADFRPISLCIFVNKIFTKVSFGVSQSSGRNTTGAPGRTCATPQLRTGLGYVALRTYRGLLAVNCDGGIAIPHPYGPIS
ncbi:uncharacterized protein [Coffea arabica]|uniref:Uncharacterized protein n=1 Tax=Coffea arabica TaxID=13443 RepID=A0ABM4V379_COFAR